MKDYPQQHHPLVQIHHLRWIIHPLVLFHWDSMLNPGGHYETLVRASTQSHPQNYHVTLVHIILVGFFTPSR